MILKKLFKKYELNENFIIFIILQDKNSFKTFFKIKYKFNKIKL